jgi:hypothetical protein
VGLSLGLRLFGLGWGIPDYDPSVMAESPYRHSYHLDEDNFLWGLALMQPSEGNFDVKIYHWGTLQFYLIYGALLGAEVVGVIPAPWEGAFLQGDVFALPRLYLIGRLVSVAFGVAGTIVIAAIGARIAGRKAGLFAGLAYAVAPLGVVEAHYLTNDISMSVLLSGGLLAVIVAAQNGKVRWLVAAGLLLGLATSAKYSALSAAPALLVAQWLVWRGLSVRGAKVAFFVTVLPWLAVAAGFLLGEPYALILPGQVIEGLRAAGRGNAIDLSLGLEPPLRMLGLQARYLGQLGLTWPLALLALGGSLLLMLGAAARLPVARRVAAFVPLPASGSSLILLAAIAGLVAGLALNRVFMLRYSQPLVPLLAVASGVAWAAIPRVWLRWAAGSLALAVAGWITLGQLTLLAGPHPANDLLAWLQANLKDGQQVARLWPEYPVLDERRFTLVRIDPWYPDLPAGSRPDYIIMDDMQLGPPSPALRELLARDYSNVARFGARPSIGSFTWDEGETPHDWKYSHPTFFVYARQP